MHRLLSRVFGGSRQQDTPRNIIYLTFEMKFQIEYCILILLAFQRPLAVVSQTQAANTVSNEEKEEVVR
jgi:hypothetical protein